MTRHALSLAGLLALAACGQAAAPAPVPRAVAGDTVTDMADAGAARIAIKGDWLAGGAGGIWLSGDGAVHRLDPRTGHRVATVRVRQGPCEASDVGFGAVWTATCRIPGLAKIDPRRNRVVAHLRLRVPPTLDGEASIGAGAGGVWLVTDGSRCRQCRVTRVDPDRLRVTGTVAVKPGAATVRTGAGAVWVANPDRDVVQRIDPAALKVVATRPTGPGPRFFAVGEGAVWTLNQGDGSVTRIALETGKPERIDAGVPGEGGDLTAGGGSVWARGSGTLLTRIDPHSHRVVARYGPPSGSGAVMVGAHAVWVSAHDIRTVWRIPLDR